ncbi:MAG: hypothetical protein ACYTF1_10285, partial [Planctomycetota bacterium]
MGTSGAERIIVRCVCGAKLSFPSLGAGRKVKCPKCKHSLVVPNPKSNNSPVTPQTDTSGTGGSAAVPAPSDLIGFNCDCGQKLKVPAGAVGKKVKCPKCSLVLVVRDPSAVVEEAEP